MIGSKDEWQAGRRATLTKFLTIKAPLVFWGKLSGNFGNFFLIRGEIAFCLQIAVKLCNALVLGWLFYCGILFGGKYRRAGVIRIKKKMDHVKIVELEMRR